MTKRNAWIIVLAVAAAWTVGVEFTLAAPTGDTNTAGDINRVVRGIVTVNETLSNVDRRVVKTRHIVDALTRTFEDTGDAELVRGDLEDAERTMDGIDGELTGTRRQLKSLRTALESIRDRRPVKNDRDAEALKLAFEQLEKVEQKQLDSEYSAETVRIAIEDLFEKISRP